MCERTAADGGRLEISHHNRRVPKTRPDREPVEPGEVKLSRFERWGTDWEGRPIVVWDDEAHAAWCEKWAPPCPDGNRVRVRRPIGFRERNVRELELRVALGGNDLGVCDVIVEGRNDEVYVRVVVCYDDSGSAPTSPEYTDCPVRTWLDQPLGDRAVIDVDSDEELPLYIPRYLDNIPQPGHGYHPARRRRAPAEPRLLPGPPEP